ncbi:MAG: metal-sensitive transcriptional regulator [Dermatophilaceae bacterium]|nr:metal-sensitive transcriptional regulator [Dermatophilaceae bacterium]
MPDTRPSRSITSEADPTGPDAVIAPATYPATHSATRAAADAGRAQSPQLGRADTPTSATHPTHAHGAPHAHTEPGYIHHKDAQLKRLRRVEGQVRGLHRMVENDMYCIDILTQVSAATKALEAVALGLLQDHLKHCLVEAATNPGADLDAKLNEASAAIARLVRS